MVRVTQCQDQRVLTDLDVARLVPPVAAIAAVRALDRSRMETPQRLALDGGSVLVMAARHRDEGTTVTKVVSVGSGPTTVSGLVLWTDASGITRPLCPSGVFTALRTAAVTALAVDLVAQPTADRLVLLGSGPQALAHARAVAAVRPLSDVALIGRDPAREEAAVRELGSTLPVRLGSRADLRQADLVCCTTTATTPLFTLDELIEDVHVSAVGSHRAGVSELPRELMAAARQVIVDDRDACCLEAGEIIDALDAGVLTRGALREIGDDLQPSGGRTVFKSVGTAAFDWALASVLANGDDR